MLPRLVLTFALATLLPWPLTAQVPSPAEVTAQAPAQFDAPAYVSIVDGSASLERDGQIETSPLNMPLLTGDRLRTTDGRVEVRFADGGRLQLDRQTGVDVLSDDLVRLTGGRIRVNVVRAAQQVTYRVDSPAGSVRILQPGEYRLAVLHGVGASGAQETQLEFAVVSGGGEIFTDQGSTPVRAGERAYASAGLMPSYAYAFNSAGADDFDRWSDMERGTVYAGASQSAQYLPQEMASYASTFDEYGDWQYQQDYGYVWYPRVAADWHPYYYGRWASYPTYGWTWIASDRFGYPTHHYGRWGVRGGLWFWIPSRYWGPAYVSWGYADAYVSWCPLGWDNHAVFSIGFYNAGPAYYAAHYHGRYYSAWTTVPRGSFGRGYVHQHAMNWDRSGSARPHFTEVHAPAGASYAMARNGSAPVRYAGTRATAAPRAETPRYINRGDQIVRSQTGQPVAPRNNAVTRPAPTQRSYAQREPRAWDNPAYRPPNYSAPATAAPAGSRPAYNAPSYNPPRGYERATPRQPLPQAQPPQRATPTYQPPNPPVRGNEGSMPRYQPQSRGYERPVQRSAPALGPSGGEHAAPRAPAPGGASRSHGRSR